MNTPHALLRRLPTETMAGREFIIRGRTEPASVARDVEIPMGPVLTAWWLVPLPECPDCGGRLVSAEVGSVPGARRCSECGSLFSVETAEGKDF